MAKRPRGQAKSQILITPDRAISIRPRWLPPQTQAIELKCAMRYLSFCAVFGYAGRINEADGENPPTALGWRGAAEITYTPIGC